MKWYTHSTYGYTQKNITIQSTQYHKSNNKKAAVVWCSGNALVLINVVILCRVRLVLGWVTFTSSNRVRTLSIINQPPRPTQPGHPYGVGKMSTGVKTGKVTAASITPSVCLLLAHDHGNRDKYCTIVAEL